MALSQQAQTIIALNRFGFSPRTVPSPQFDARAALLAELDSPQTGQIDSGDLLNSGAAMRAVFEFRQERKAERMLAREATKSAKASAEMEPGAGGTAGAGAKSPDMKGTADAAKPPQAKRGPGLPQQIYLAEAKARFDAALAADCGFVERLVWFWSNHFCVSADKGPVRSLCGAFEREAIRPHVRGKFADMLIAVESHPAMLLYLDNARSMGPDSIAGQRRNKGLNENLAREILELHTVGVRTGYSQDDVTNFAKVITGWSITPPRRPDGGEFVFNPRLHEPGAQHVIGHVYAEPGIGQGRAVLLALAKNPATARHIATKLARHFVADDPPPALVERLAACYRDTDGDLKELAKVLVTASEAWDAPRAKLRKPSEWLVNALRVLDLSPPDVRPLIQALNLLGEPLWRPPAPNGFSDDSNAWLDGIAERLDVANQMSRRAGVLTDPQEVAARTLGPLLSADTRQTLARAESRPQALALLLMSPELQRR